MRRSSSHALDKTDPEGGEEANALQSFEPTNSLQVADRKKTKKTKRSIYLSGASEADALELAERCDLTVSEVVRRGIAIEKFIADQLDENAEFLISRDKGQTFERVHFVLG